MTRKRLICTVAIFSLCFINEAKGQQSYPFLNPDPGPVLHAPDANGESNFLGVTCKIDPAKSPDYTNMLFPNPLLRDPYTHPGTNQIVGFLNVGCSYVLGPSASFDNATLPANWGYTYSVHEGEHTYKYYGVHSDPLWGTNQTTDDWEFEAIWEFEFRMVRYKTWGAEVGVTHHWTDPYSNQQMEWAHVQSGYDFMTGFGESQFWDVVTE
ncbi:hypothetical protein [Rhodopirellula bahusiensis]|uniref:Uncharacterized protein n=1 Tax=Rhodopirellula bahusiensis TaxID=2014065 RepID=A0A2G1VXN0_9BACT|nr:hypothetical protein [Rhodopirellula bahusiensis]PHQ31505.1 hypothetical protein CEE69_30875 [Rhodopirellula bahusiensis]